MEVVGGGREREEKEDAEERGEWRRGRERNGGRKGMVEVGGMDEYGLVFLSIVDIQTEFRRGVWMSMGWYFYQ